MNKLFYTKLAAQNIKKNSRFYFPYLLTCIGTIAGFYIMCSITFDEGISKMPGAAPLQTILYMGCFIVGIFAAIFLFYTNSFLMKRRKKEIGLYNILGMGKRHIAIVLFFESLFVGMIGIVGGLALGILFNKLILLALFKIMDFGVPFGFSISVPSIVVTCILFGIIIIVTLLSNLAKVHVAKPIELLYGNNMGEKEPKTKWILAILGVLLLGTGYYIALTVEDPILALSLYFLAVICVILGTYCLFTAVSIAVLKLLRKNKAFYYQPKHFTAVSGMIYRMKQNAVGLANICILSTMVLVMISTTVSLYAGAEDSLLKLYPSEVTVYVDVREDKDAVKNDIAEAVAKNELSMENVSERTYLSFGAGKIGNEFTFDRERSDAAAAILCICTTEEYNRLTGKDAALNEGEVLLYTANAQAFSGKFLIGDREFRVRETLQEFPEVAMFLSYLSPVYYMVVPDEGTFTAIEQMQKNAYGEAASVAQYSLGFDLNGSKEEEKACIKDIGNSLQMQFTIRSRMESADSFYGLYGGFLFLGLFLAVLFTMAAVLIIYYKQVSEGYEDKERFEIMQKVGMSHSEVKHTINAQILMVFFLPILVACIHLAFNFKIMTKLLMLFGLVNCEHLFLICTGITIGVFCIVYGLVYLLTSKTYYKIVRRG